MSTWTFGQQGFDASGDYGTFGDFSPIPAGKYLVMAIKSERKETKSGTGNMLEIEWDILDGPCKGRKLFSRLNLENPNETAVRIARAELKAICMATGVMAPKSSYDLHDIPIVVDVTVEKRSDDPSKYRNEIKGYYSRSAAPQQQAPAPAVSAGANAAGDQPPWKRG